MNQRMIDSHCHTSMIGQVYTMADADNLQKIIDACGYEKSCVQVITYFKDRNINRNPLALMQKAACPDRIFVFGGIEYPKPGHYDACDFVNEARKLRQMGFDGLKMYAKPTVTGDFKLPLDAEPFLQLYDYCSQNNFPILFHVGDPASFWMKDQCPDWAMANDWYYGDDPKFPTYDEQYAQCERFMDLYPELKVTFAHFFFLSDDLPRLAGMLRRHPNMQIDITPGSELYFTLSQKPEEARAFFLEFSDRILYGTDTMGDGRYPKQAIQHGVELKNIIWRFLSTSDCFDWDGHLMQSLSLPQDVLDKIYYQNFLRILGHEMPCPLDKQAVLNGCEEWYRRAELSDDQEEIDLQEMRSIINRIREYLEH